MKRIERGIYETRDGRFRVTREDPARPHRGWYVRELTGPFADPDGRWEPMVLTNGLTFAPTMLDALRLIPRQVREAHDA